MKRLEKTGIFDASLGTFRIFLARFFFADSSVLRRSCIETISWLPGVCTPELRVVVVLLLFLMWCFYLPGHLTKTFALLLQFSSQNLCKKILSLSCLTFVKFDAS